MLDFLKNHWRDGIEILVLTICVYQMYRAFRNTRGAQILIGLGSILIVLTLISELLDFQVVGFLITRGSGVLALALLIIFQPELRDALARLGSKRVYPFFTNKGRAVLFERFSDSVINLSKKRIGALFAIQRGISLKKHLDTGVVLDAKFSPELAMAVFHPKAPLHDGGLIIAEDRVAGAACVFPVTQREMHDRSTGLRHRAAIGLTEETDAVAVVVSEETGGISICIDGKLERNLTEKQFRDRINELFISRKPANETDNAEKLGGEAALADSRDRDMVSD
ncbi:MAG TPA: diadenylate cyclase CdaA [Luteolibacter sp.]|nr:diadenylate cyclase CdaA [Luteolibacter sp.]